MEGMTAEQFGLKLIDRIVQDTPEGMSPATGLDAATLDRLSQAVTALVNLALVGQVETAYQAAWGAYGPLVSAAFARRVELGLVRCPHGVTEPAPCGACDADEAVEQVAAEAAARETEVWDGIVTRLT